MHYESLRLHINEIEDASCEPERAQQSEGVVKVDREQEDEVVNQSQDWSSSSSDNEHEDDDDYFSEDDMYYDDEADSDDLCLSRYPSTIFRPTQSIPVAPELESDDSSDSDEDDSPPPSPEMVRAVVTCGSTDTISLMYEAAQAAACLGSPVSTPFTTPWELSTQGAKVSTSHRMSLGEAVC